tara:strand:+ start:8266 stop:8838 length:573 start_codon:yes stop_codon:yes gene_type:complete
METKSYSRSWKSIFILLTLVLTIMTPAIANPQNFTCYAGTPQETTIFMETSPAGDVQIDRRNVEWKFAVQSINPLFLGAPTEVTLNFTHPFDVLNIEQEYEVITPPVNPIGAPLTEVDYVTIQYVDDINGYRTADLYFDLDPTCIFDVDYALDTEPNMLSTDFQKGAILVSITALGMLFIIYNRNGLQSR